MKRIACVLLLVLMVSGCSGVLLNAEYSQLLDETAAWTAEAAKRAEAGQLDPNGMTTALRYSADHWKAFQDARDGRKPE